MSDAVFISYRRADSADEVARLHEALRRRLGEGRVFLDVESMRAGDRFADRISDVIGGCEATIVVIGPDWAGSRADGSSRLHETDDLVRIEVATALGSGCDVTPIALRIAPPSGRLDASCHRRPPPSVAWTTVVLRNGRVRRPSGRPRCRRS